MFKFLRKRRVLTVIEEEGEVIIPKIPVFSETKDVVKFTQRLEYARQMYELRDTKDVIVAELQANEHSSLTNYVIVDYKMNLPERKLYIEVCPYYYSTNKKGKRVRMVLQEFSIIIAYSNVLRVEKINGTKFYIYTEGEFRDEIHRVVFRMSDEDENQSEQLKLETNSMNARYKPSEYIPTYQHMKEENYLEFIYLEHLDRLSIPVDSVFGKARFIDKMNNEYIFFLRNNYEKMFEKNTFDGYLIDKYTSSGLMRPIIMLELKDESSVVKLIDFVMGNHQNKGLGKQILPFCEKLIAEKYDVSEIVGILSHVDNGNIDKRNHVYESLGYSVSETQIRKTLK